jgi:hypothetical protein
VANEIREASLRVPKTSSMSCDLGVFMDDAAKAIRAA